MAKHKLEELLIIGIVGSFCIGCNLS